MKKEYNAVKITGMLMFGDVDGFQKLEDYTALEYLPLLKDWFYAYSKKYPKDVKNERFWVNYTGSYDYPARINWDIVKEVVDFTEPKTKKVHWSGAKIELSYSSESGEPFFELFKDELSAIETEDDLRYFVENLDEGFIDPLLAYAYYWDTHGRDDKYLIKYEEIGI